MREDKRHPADQQPQQVHECVDCGRTANLSIFRNEGVCHICRTKRDVETVKRVADQQTGHSNREKRALRSVQALAMPDRDITPIEQIVWCNRCARHTVAEVGQECPHCQR